MRGRDFSLTPFGGENESHLKIKGRIERASHNCFISYELFGALSGIVVPAPAEVPERKDRLWEETCFELFIRPEDSERYWEFNLSPAGHWNVYRFAYYREGMEEEMVFNSLPFNIESEPEALRLSLLLDLKKIVPADQALNIAVSAVIKTKDGRLTYWALTHPGPGPDFHKKESFILSL